LSAGRNLLIAILTGALGAVYVTGLGVYAVAQGMAVGRALAPEFAALGLHAQRFLVFGRRYQGTVRGRAVRVDFMPASGLRPAQLNLYVAATLDTRMALGRRRPLLDCRACSRLDVPGVGLEALQVYAPDEARAMHLLADPLPRAILVRLFDAHGLCGLRELYLQPERVWLRVHPRALAEGQVRRLLDDLLALVELSERALA
jgi:hypothetical protein